MVASRSLGGGALLAQRLEDPLAEGVGVPLGDVEEAQGQHPPGTVLLLAHDLAASASIPGCVAEGSSMTAPVPSARTHHRRDQSPS